MHHIQTLIPPIKATKIILHPHRSQIAKKSQTLSAPIFLKPSPIFSMVSSSLKQDYFHQGADGVPLHLMPNPPSNAQTSHIPETSVTPIAFTLPITQEPLSSSLSTPVNMETEATTVQETDDFSLPNVSLLRFQEEEVHELYARVGDVEIFSTPAS